MFTFFMLPFVWLITLIYGLEVSRRVAVHLLLSVATMWFIIVAALILNNWLDCSAMSRIFWSATLLFLIAFLFFFVTDMHREKQRRKTVFFLYLLCVGGLYADWMIGGTFLFLGCC